MISLETRSVSSLDVYSTPYDIRRDVHTFVAYVREREVKRTVRENALYKADARRLAQLMSHPDCPQHVERDGHSWWLDAIDRLALKLGFVDYDTEGEYRGYTSHSPSFSDNYIEFQADVYDPFLARPLLEQEQTLLALLRDNPNYNEFFQPHWQSSLNPFPQWGMATGVMPHLDIPAVRRFLFRLLADLDPGRWYDTASLIAYLKTNHPTFLIPPKEDLPQKDHWNRPIEVKRYGNFREYDKDHYYRNRDPIPDAAPDGFARVEGRFVERFLEGIPLTLGYVDVAYSPEPYQGRLPEMGTLQAFRIKEPFHQLMHEEALTPAVTVLPTFEIHVDAPFYPAGLVQELQTFATLVKEDKISIFKLEKTEVKRAQAADADLDVVATLRQLSRQPLPQNVAVELEEWAGQSDIFTLYSDVAVLEGDPDLPEVTPFVLAQISPQIRLVDRPEAAYLALKKAERVPLIVDHPPGRVAPLPPNARTIFPKKKPKKAARAKKKKKPAVTLQRETRTTLTAPTDAFYEKLRAALLKERCLFEADAAQRAITYTEAYRPQVEAALKALGKGHTITVEDVTP